MIPFAGWVLWLVALVLVGVVVTLFYKIASWGVKGC